VSLHNRLRRLETVSPVREYRLPYRALLAAHKAAQRKGNTVMMDYLAARIQARAGEHS
jgi:hypothetical protein